MIKARHQKAEKEHNQNKKLKEKQLVYETMQRVLDLVESGVDVRFGDWTPFDVDVINEMSLLTSKPVVFLCNMAPKDYNKGTNKYIEALREFIAYQPEQEPCIAYSAKYEAKLASFESADERAKFCEGKKSSAFPEIVWAGYQALHLQHFYTCGPDEVKCWTIRQRTKAPQAAGTIHGDFEKCFIKAQIMKFDDLKELGDEAEVKAKGKVKDKGKDYVMEDGDIVHFQHNA